MDKIFAQTLKNLTLGTFKSSKPGPSERIFKNWDLSLFLLYDVKLHWKKYLKTDDPEIADKWEKEQSQIDTTLL